MSTETSPADPRMIAHIRRFTRIPLVIGGLTTVFAVGWLVLRGVFVANALPAEGVVDAVEQKSDSSVWHARFTFQDLQGRRHTTEASFLSPTLCPSIKVGNTVAVRYSADKPEDALIATAGTLWIYPGFVLVLGLFFLFGGLVFRFVARMLENAQIRREESP